jgi:hypothetical protein
VPRRSALSPRRHRARQGLPLPPSKGSKRRTARKPPRPTLMVEGLLRQVGDFVRADGVIWRVDGRGRLVYWEPAEETPDEVLAEGFF